tara:strand:- start:1557 stop:2621 length:1065 start_codon:yes stop_codon:yes gene_type:complete
MKGYVMRISQAQNILVESFKGQLDNPNGRDATNIICHLQAKSGTGKSTVVKDTAVKLSTDNEKWVTYILSLAQMDAAEIAGVIFMQGDDAARSKPFWLVQIEKLSTENHAVILFLDELPQAPVSNMNVAAQLVYERRIGDYRLPDNVVMVSAGNKKSERAGTNNMPWHLVERLMFLDIDVDVDDAVAYLSSVGVSSVITGFIRYRPELISKVDRDNNQGSSPRAYERLNTILNMNLNEVDKREAVASMVGDGICAELYGFMKVHNELVSFEDIVANPMSAKISEDPAVNYALSSLISSKVNDNNIGAVIQYINRLPHQEFAVLTMKDAISRTPSIKSTKEFRAWALTNAKALVA